MFRVIARTTYGDPTTDVLRDFPSMQEARTFIEGLGFHQTEDTGFITYFALPFKTMRHGKEEDAHMAGYIISNVQEKKQ